ncbi:MAG: ABC transporter permease [Acidobacteriaceae bacterium]
MTSLWADLRYAFRQLRKSPGFTVTAVLTLALGIGATTAIFSVVEGVLLRPLPFPDASRLVVMGDHLTGVELQSETNVTAPDTVAYTHDTRAFSSLGGYIGAGYELSGSVQPVNVNATRLSSGVLPTLGVAPLMGRFFTPQEEEHSQHLAVLSYATWKSRFHADPNILGQKILLDRQPYIVIGVMPRNFEFPLQPGHLSRTELWVPLSLSHDELGQLSSWNYSMVARLKPGVTAVQAQADAERVAQQIMRGYPAFMTRLHISAVIQPLRASTVAAARPLIHVLFLAVLVVLLIACANLAGLLLVRAVRRRRETAVRLALGSSSKTLVQQAVIESLVLSVTGGIIGIGLAAIAIRASISFLPENLPRINDIHLNWVVIVFALLLAVGTGILCGLAPAFAALHTNMNEALKEGGRTGSVGGGHARLRSILVVSEIAVALVLLIASGLLLRSFQKMRDVDLGFHPDHTVIAFYSLPQKQYATQASVDSFNHELLLRLKQLPATQSIGIADTVPMTGGTNNDGFVVEGYVQPKGALVNMADVDGVEGDYFRAMGISLLRGRSFTPSDIATGQLVAIVNRKLAEHYWPGISPVGKRIRVGTNETKTPYLTVVGEIDDVKTTGPDGDTHEQYYQPVEQENASLGQFANPSSLNGNSMYVALRSSIPPHQMENSLRAVFHSLDPQLAIMQVQTMDEAVSNTEAPRRFNTTIITAFGVIAVLLAILGIYSVVAFSVALRTQEMAIRLALGASRSGIRQLILVSGARLALIGCAIGLAGAIGATRLLQSLLFQVNPFDPLVLIASAVVILMLSVVASAMPAQRAATVDPMHALRDE